MLCFTESRHIWEKETSWKQVGLAKHAVALCTFLKAFLWKLLVLVNKVIVILEEIFTEGEQMQACASQLDHKATWSQRRTKHPDSELNCDLGSQAASSGGNQTLFHLLIESLQSSLPSTEGRLFFHQTLGHSPSSRFSLSCNHNYMITGFLLGSRSSQGHLDSQCCASSHLWKMRLNTSTSPQQGTERTHTLTVLEESWMKIMTSATVVRLPELEGYTRSSVI